MDSADEERVEIRGTALLSVTIQELRTKRPFLLLFVLRFVPFSPLLFSLFLSPFSFLLSGYSFSLNVVLRVLLRFS